jgi:hypothetical protein
MDIHNIIKKGLVIGVVFLFFGASVILVIGGDEVINETEPTTQGTAGNFCAGTELLTTGDFSDPAPLNNQVKIVFKNVTFSDASNIQLDVSAIVYSSSTGAGFPAMITDTQITTEYAIVDLQGWNGNSWVDLYLDDIVQVSYTAVEQGTGAGSSQTDIVTGVIPYDNNPPYNTILGLIKDVSSEIPSGFTLVDVTAKGRKVDKMTGEIVDEPPLILYPKVNGTNIEIRVWAADGEEYGDGADWSGRTAHIEYTLFMKTEGGPSIPSGTSVVAGQLTGSPQNLENITMSNPLPGANATNTYVVASGFKTVSSVNTPLAVRGTVQSSNLISFEVWDINGDIYNPAAWDAVEINYCVVKTSESECMVGDCNGDGIINIGDVVYLITYLYRGGPPPI